MPASIRDSYQYFTEASVKNLRRAGYNAEFTELATAVRRMWVSFSTGRTGTGEAC